MRRQTILVAVSLLALSIAAPALAQSPSLSVGASVEGQIAEGDAVAADDAYLYDEYALNLRAGQRVEAVMRSEAFDAFLEVYRPGEDRPLASDDDGLGQGTDSRLRFTAARSGAYVLRARPLSGLGGGDYSLSLTERPPAGRAPRPSRIGVGQSLEGVLAAGDPETEDGLAYDAFVFRARAGERFMIDLISDAFDPVVRVGRMQGGDFHELAMNDDGPDTGLNSRLVFTAPTTGDYIIRATPLIAGGEGVYKLALAAGPGAGGGATHRDRRRGRGRAGRGRRQERRGRPGRCLPVQRPRGAARPHRHDVGRVRHLRRTVRRRPRQSGRER
jgi:hypothetical protein